MEDIKHTNKVKKEINTHAHIQIDNYTFTILF